MLKILFSQLAPFYSKNMKLICISGSYSNAWALLVEGFLCSEIHFRYNNRVFSWCRSSNRALSRATCLIQNLKTCSLGLSSMNVSAPGPALYLVVFWPETRSSSFCRYNPIAKHAVEKHSLVCLGTCARGSFSVNRYKEHRLKIPYELASISLDIFSVSGKSSSSFQY